MSARNAMRNAWDAWDLRRQIALLVESGKISQPDPQENAFLLSSQISIPDQ